MNDLQKQKMKNDLRKLSESEFEKAVEEFINFLNEDEEEPKEKEDVKYFFDRVEKITYLRMVFEEAERRTETSKKNVVKVGLGKKG